MVVTLTQTKRFQVFNIIEISYLSQARKPTSIKECAIHVLSSKDLFEKAKLTAEYVAMWRERQIDRITDEFSAGIVVPAQPARPEIATLESQLGNPEQKKVPLKKNAIEISIHGIAHAESWAIDLFWDVIARFCHENLPLQFYDDMVRIAGQEGEHFLSWIRRLEALGCPYGTLPVHNGLWRAADESKDNLLNRLLSVNLIHEARWLDTYPLTRARLLKAGDEASVAVLDNNYKEEITHVGAGITWFTHMCQRQHIDPIATFHDKFPTYYEGIVKQPNLEARAEAGMSLAWLSPFL